jgi:hypothetical protein
MTTGGMETNVKEIEKVSTLGYFIFCNEVRRLKSKSERKGNYDNCILNW